MSVTWTLNAGQAAARAYRMLGRLTPPYTLSDDQWQQALIVENGLLQGLQVAGPNVFRQTPTALTVSAGSATVSIPNDVVGIEEARWAVSSTYDRPMGRFQWVQYFQLPNKQAQSTSGPSIFMFDYQKSSTELYIWPIATLGGTINCTTVRRANNVEQQSDAIDLPAEWIEGFTCMLAEELMDDEAMADMDAATAQRISARASYWKQRLEDFDRPTSVFIRPWGKQGAGPFWR